jgi:hypothetical protein
MNSFQQQTLPINEDRFIWPLIPFLGGAAIGYIAGRPQYNYSYPSYYPVYYPYYVPYYNNTPNTYNNTY